MAERLQGRPVSRVISRPDSSAWQVIEAPEEVSPLIQQPVVARPRSHDPGQRPVAESSAGTSTMAEQIAALGFIETQGFTAVFEAIDTACKAANVEVVGKEKLGGGYVTVIVKGDVAAVKAAVEAGQQRVEGLGKLIAAHVIARPSESVLSLLPKV
jgi:ethanolamine utilization microcompartment shell protein EutS